LQVIPNLDTDGLANEIVLHVIEMIYLAAGERDSQVTILATAFPVMGRDRLRAKAMVTARQILGK